MRVVVTEATLITVKLIDATDTVVVPDTFPAAWVNEVAVAA